MKAKLNRALYPRPSIYNLYKPPGPSSNVVLGTFKRILPKGYGRIGHFGTLDPFACGVLLVGVAGASRFNDFIHDCYPKTYLAVGKLGAKTITGDYTHPEKSLDESDYFRKVISRFDRAFLQEQFSQKFIGEYWQAPPAFSAAKFEGRPLHEWAREGEFIPKEKVKRQIFSIQVIKYNFPFISFSVTASSGTYIRTLFEEMAHHLGTYGMLTALARSEIGPCRLRDSLRIERLKTMDPSVVMTLGVPVERVLPFPMLNLDQSLVKKFTQGVMIENSCTPSILGPYVWVGDEAGEVKGLAKIDESQLRPYVVFSEGIPGPI